MTAAAAAEAGSFGNVFGRGRGVHGEAHSLLSTQPTAASHRALAERADHLDYEAVGADVALLHAHQRDTGRPLLEAFREQLADRMWKMAEQAYRSDLGSMLHVLAMGKDDTPTLRACHAAMAARAPEVLAVLLNRPQAPAPETVWSACVWLHEDAVMETYAPKLAATPHGCLVGGCGPEHAEALLARAGGPHAFKDRYGDLTAARRLLRRIYQESMGMTGSVEWAADAVREALGDDLDGARVPLPHQY